MRVWALADAFERSAANSDGEPDVAAAIVAELRERAAAGIRFWPVRTYSTPHRQQRRHSTNALLALRSRDITDLITDKTPG